MSAYAAASLIDAGYLAVATRNTYKIDLRSLLPWSSLARVAASCALASLALFSVRLGGGPVLLLIAAAALAYAAVFALALYALRVPEAFTLLGWLKQLRRGSAVHRA